MRARAKSSHARRLPRENAAAQYLDFQLIPWRANGTEILLQKVFGVHIFRA
jgi:hypothetical protein